MAANITEREAIRYYVPPSERAHSTVVLPKVLNSNLIRPLNAAIHVLEIKLTGTMW